MEFHLLNRTRQQDIRGTSDWTGSLGEAGSENVKTEKKTSRWIVAPGRKGVYSKEGIWKGEPINAGIISATGGYSTSFCQPEVGEEAREREGKRVDAHCLSASFRFESGLYTQTPFKGGRGEGV